MDTSLATVRKAIEFRRPAYIPNYAGPDSDVAGLGFTWRMLNRTPDTYTTECVLVQRELDKCLCPVRDSGSSEVSPFTRPWDSAPDPGV